jgi:D-alanine-D-alanine ligase
MLEALKGTKPLLIFNLVEAVFGNGKLSYLAPSILEALNIKYTGNSAEAIFLTTNKIVTKKLLKFCGISTPQWITNSDLSGFIQGDRYIIKPVYEDGSLGLLQDSIVNTGCIYHIIERLNLMKEETGKDFFAEKYIDGREINISMLGENGTPLVLPPREIKFIGYKERNFDEILDYRSKWEEDSFEYKNTISSNIFEDSDRLLLNELEEISIRCWDEFGLKGYARVDFRIDREGKPWVLEINANPCITPGGSGYLSSALKGGLDFKDVVKRIISEV